MSRIGNEELLSEEELDKRIQRRKRQKAVDFARANMGLSGFKLSEKSEELARRFVEGEITMQEMINERLESAKEHGGCDE